MNVDAACSHCEHHFHWLCGTPLRCPACQQLPHPQPITWGQYQEERSQQAQRKEGAQGAGVGAPNRQAAHAGVTKG
jgi:hypothetical protein